MDCTSQRTDSWTRRIGVAIAFIGVTLLSMPTLMARDQEVVCRVELDQGVLLAGQAHKVILKVSLEGQVIAEAAERLPVNLAVVLDRSGSMGSGDKIEKAKEAAIEALRRLGPKDIFSLVIYDHNVETLVPAQRAENVAWIEARIRSIEPGGNTALFNGVCQAAAEIRKDLADTPVNRILLLSDGLANVGPSSPQDLGRLGASFIKEGISVTTVGVGTDYNEDLMAQLAQKSDGNTYFVEEGEDLPRIFAAELGDVLSVVARKVNVKIQCPEGILPLSLIGREGRISGRMVEMRLNQIYGGQEKYALIEVEVPAGRRGENREIALAEVTYENPFTRAQTTVTGRATARFSEDKREVEATLNVGVQRDYQLQQNALAQDQAIALADQGKEAEAKRALNDSARALRLLGEQHDDEELLKKAEAMEEQAQSLEEEGMSKRNRKKMRADSYQDKNQQMAK